MGNVWHWGAIGGGGDGFELLFTFFVVMMESGVCKIVSTVFVTDPQNDAKGSLETKNAVSYDTSTEPHFVGKVG